VSAVACSRCPRPAGSRGLCRSCYSLAWRHGEFGMFSAMPAPVPAGRCGHPGCQAAVHARGLCRRHGHQVATRGRVTDLARWWNPPGGWTGLAECATSDPDAWFPGSYDTATAAMARRICQGCPVRPECLAYALDTAEEHGIWGGLDPAERAQLRAARQDAA